MDVANYTNSLATGFEPRSYVTEHTLKYCTENIHVKIEQRKIHDNLIGNSVCPPVEVGCHVGILSNTACGVGCVTRAPPHGV